MVGGLSVMAPAASAGPVIAQTSPGHEAQPQKMLRYAFLIAQTTFDPAQITDLYPRTVAASIFDAPLENAFLARPTQMRTNTAAALPELSEDFKTSRSASGPRSTLPTTRHSRGPTACL